MHSYHGGFGLVEENLQGQHGRLHAGPVGLLLVDQVVLEVLSFYGLELVAGPLQLFQLVTA